MTVLLFPRAKSELTVATTSVEVDAMAADLELISDVRAGLRAMRARANIYLPRYAAEDAQDYQRRVTDAPWRAEFNDALLTLASKPFTEQVSFHDGTPEPILRFAADVDGEGNGLHVFARRLFLDGLANGVTLLLVDAPIAPEGVRTAGR